MDRGQDSKESHAPDWHPDAGCLLPLLSDVIIRHGPTVLTQQSVAE